MNARAIAAILATVLVVILGCTVALIAPSKATARDVEPEWTWRVPPSDITNTKALREMRLEKLKSKLDAAVEEWRAQKEAEEQAALEAAYYYEPTYYAPSYDSGIYYADYSDAYNTDGPSHTMPGWYDGYLETYYNASSHYLASTWTLDSEGFYHDENGRYVVGVEISHADEMPYGTVVQTGKGEGVVYDYGSGAEVHDFATNW